MSSPASTHTAVADLAATYDRAWSAHDVDQIIRMHADEMVFHLHSQATPPVTGEDALRAYFTALFQAWPDLSFDSSALEAGADFYVHRYTMRVTRDPSATPIDAVDVVRCRDGRVTRKDTYVDTSALLEQIAGTAR